MRPLCHKGCHAVRQEHPMESFSPLSRVSARSLSLSSLQYRITAVGRPLLGGYPAYNSPVPLCIGAAPPAEPPSRDIKPWRLGQPWTKVQTISSIPLVSLYRRFLSAFWAPLQASDVYICPNHFSWSFCLLCLSLQDMLPVMDGKKEVPQIFGLLPVGDLH